jgi:hypothetical protein
MEITIEDQEHSGFCDVWLGRIPPFFRVVYADHWEVTALLRMWKPRVEVQRLPILNDALSLFSLLCQQREDGGSFKRSLVTRIFCNSRRNGTRTPRPRHGRVQRQEPVTTNRVKRCVRARNRVRPRNLLVGFTPLVPYPIASTTSTRSGRLHDVRTRILPDPANTTPASCSDSHNTKPRTEDENHRAG